MVKVIIGAKVEDELKARFAELAEKNGKNVNQLLGELVSDYLDTHDEKRKKAQKTIEKLDEKVKTALCPLCDASLFYSKGWFDDEIRCSNSACDTHGKFPLKREMGEREYFRLLNLRRRAFAEGAVSDQEKKETKTWQEEFGEVFGVYKK